MEDKQMKYLGMSAGMWMLFSGSFQKQLVETLGCDHAAARQIAKKQSPGIRQSSPIFRNLKKTTAFR